MLANHTSVASVRAPTCLALSLLPASLTLGVSCPLQLFKRMIDQFDRLKRRNAFVEQYKKEKIFQDSLEEFDDARSVFASAQSLI